MTSLGQELKKDREARGISLKAVADTTRITQRYLEALESDQLDILPGGFFVKSILRNYVKAVGLDEEEVLERYRRAGVLAAREPDKARKQASEVGGSKKRTRSLAGAAAAVIVILSFAVYFLTRPGKPSAPPAAVSPPPAATTQPEQLPPPAGPDVEAGAAPEAEKGLRLEMTFIAKTWIQVYADGRLALDGLRSAGDSAEVRADAEFLVHLGNAGGLTYALNGKPGKPFGRSGAVVKNIRITAGNLRSFLTEDGTGVE
jgi:cytoskeletal protein RodZ